MADYTFDENIFSDLYKDTYGFRPRNHQFYDDDTTLDEKQEIWNRLLSEHRDEMDRMEELEVSNEAKFERTIQEVIEAGAGDRVTAIRWLIDAECDRYDLMYGFSYIQYNFGISYKYEKEIQPIIDNIMAIEEAQAV